MAVLNDLQETHPANLPLGSKIVRDGATATKRFMADPQWYAPGFGWFNNGQASDWIKKASSVTRPNPGGDQHG